MTETTPAKAAGHISLVEANAMFKRRREAQKAKRDACIAEMLKPYVEAYGAKDLKKVRSFLRDVIDGKRMPHEKKVPLRIPPDGLIGVHGYGKSVTRDQAA